MKKILKVMIALLAFALLFAGVGSAAASNDDASVIDSAYALYPDVLVIDYDTIEWVKDNYEYIEWMIDNCPDFYEYLLHKYGMYLIGF